MSNEKPHYNRAHHWAINAVEMAFFFAFLIWLGIVLQDWLFSTVDPFPYLGSAITGSGVLVGFVCLLRVRRLIVWQETLLVGASIITICDMLGLMPHDWAILPTMAVLAVGLALPPLWVCRQKLDKLQRGLCIIAILVGVAAIVRFASTSANLTKALQIGAAMLGTCGLALLAANLSGQKDGGAAKCVILASTGMITFLTVAVLLLIYVTFIPALTTFTTDTNGLLGEGFGGYSGDLPGTYLYAREIVNTQGLLGIFSMVFVLIAALAAGVLALVCTIQEPDYSARIQLCAGSLSALVGMLLITDVGAPFLTSRSYAGTWALALTVASLGLSGLRRPPAQDRAPTSTGETKPIVHRCMRNRTVLTGVGVTFLITATWAAAYASTLKIIRPFTGTSAPSAYSSYATLSNIPQAMQDATVAMEDRHFYEHDGIDWKAIHRALRVNLRSGRVRQGGSTITQQLAKNLFLTKERTLGRKFREAVLTLQMERMLSKHRILEIYLNTIDYGMGQRGINAASRYYFHKNPTQLTLAESAVLVSFVPQPPQARLSIQKIDDGRVTALQRLAGAKLGHYSEADIVNARKIPLDRLIYPYKRAWDCGAIDDVPAVWQGITFRYSAGVDDEPRPIAHVSPLLKLHLLKFLKEAQRYYGVVGIDHIGVYNDRLMRMSVSAQSAHAFGQAIDISGFRYANGSIVRVKDHTKPHILARLLPLRRLLKKHFDLLIDWQNDPKHHDDHFHAEVKGIRRMLSREPVPD